MANEPIVHVPAWKRLGLKLKHAARPENAQEPATKKRRLNEEDADRPSSIEQTRAPDIQPYGADLALLRNQTHLTEITNGTYVQRKRLKTPEDDTFVHIPPRSGAKVVSFSAETKLEDGDGGPDLSHGSGNIDGDVRDIRATRSDSIGTLKPKKKRNPKTPAAAAVTSANKLRHNDNLSLAYLKSYYNDRMNWKFNKTHQTWLLKNLFDLHRIPAEHDAALISYFTGLQGRSARARLKSDAQALLAPGTAVNMNETEAQDIPPKEMRKDGSAKPHRSHESGTSLRTSQDDEKIRAQKVLEALEVQSSAQSEQDQREASGGPQREPKRRTKSRGRKRRTGAGDLCHEDGLSDSSSSSSSSSGSNRDSSLHGHSSPTVGQPTKSGRMNRPM